MKPFFSSTRARWSIFRRALRAGTLPMRPATCSERSASFFARPDDTFPIRVYCSQLMFLTKNSETLQKLLHSRSVSMDSWF